MRALFLWLGLLLVGLASGLSARAADAPDDLSTIEDPRRLDTIGRQALSDNDIDRARYAFTERLKRLELATYLPLRADLDQALLAESLQEYEKAARLYRAAADIDPLRAVLVLRIQSEHPDRDKLTAELMQVIRDRADAARRGAEDALIYTTTKGDPRYLEVKTTQDILDAARDGRPTQYCYVETLDFTKAARPLPDDIQLNRCVISEVRGSALEFGKLVLIRSFVLGKAVFGKEFDQEVHKSAALPPAEFRDMTFRETVFMGDANFDGVHTSAEGRAYFPLVVFEGVATFKGAEFDGMTDFRFASFGKGANFRLMRMGERVYFGGARYRADTVFSSVYSARQAYFNESHFEGSVDFDRCEFAQGATFESSHFGGKASFGTTRVVETLNLSRAVFAGEVNVKELHAGSLDALGTHFMDDAWFMDATIEGRSRFSLDEVTRHSNREDLDSLLQIYRDYQGDPDAEEPITTRSSYGVTSLDDLSARIDRNISFANTRFGGYTVFERVQFGTEGEESSADFFNAQFQSETHFENTTWTGRADFTTIFGREVAFNNARFQRSLILDDANVAGRVNLTDASFADDADLSFYGAEITSFEIDRSHIEGTNGKHRLFYEACAQGDIRLGDIRIARMRYDGVKEEDTRKACHDFVVDEFVTLKQSFGDRAMTSAEDDAYWYTRHYETMMAYRFGTPGQQVSAALALVLFEWAFGWGVQLVNLGIASAFVTVVFALLYRLLCPDTILVYDGENIPIRQVSFIGLCFVSLQSLIAINTGWDFGDDNHTFRYLNTLETLVGFIVLTFFVGAYTRMILA